MTIEIDEKRTANNVFHLIMNIKRTHFIYTQHKSHIKNGSQQNMTEK